MALDRPRCNQPHSDVAGAVATQAAQVGLSKQLSEAAAPAPSSGGERRNAGQFAPSVGAEVELAHAADSSSSWPAVVSAHI